MIKDKLIYKILLVALLLPVILIVMWCGFHVHQLVTQRADILKDYSELNSLKNGLLSVDTWRAHITEIVSDEIDAFDLSDMQEDTLKKSLNKILNSVITKANEMMNKKQKRLDKKIKQFAIR